jgi:molybdate transport system substrate-binding protein
MINSADGLEEGGRGGEDVAVRVALVVFGLLLLPQAAAAAEIKVMIPPPVREALNALIPRFEQASGHKVAATYESSWLLVGRIEKGEVSDVVFLTAAQSDDLIKRGLLARRVDLARSTIGLAVRAGAPKPDIGTADKFMQTLLAAKSFARNEGADSGRFMVALLERLGITEAMTGKTTLVRQGHVATLVARGEVELAAQQMSELMAVSGVEAVPLPAEIQHVIVFSAGVPAAPKAGAAADELIRYLKSPIVTPVFRAKGLDPAR